MTLPICEKLRGLLGFLASHQGVGVETVIGAAGTIEALVEAGGSLAQELRMNKAGITQALTKRELGFLMDALHKMNVALARARSEPPQATVDEGEGR